MLPYEGQSFSALRRQCRQNRRLFEDPLFPTSDQSLFYQTNHIGRVTWKRPKVRKRNALLDRRDIKRNDPDQLYRSRADPLIHSGEARNREAVGGKGGVWSRDKGEHIKRGGIAGIVSCVCVCVNGNYRDCETEIIKYFYIIIIIIIII